jgi:small subunit ribosomal protein S17
MAKVLIGRVVSDKPDKSIVVKVVTHKQHPLYKKQYISSNKFMAHDEQNEAQEGDKVSIIETRPLSARKRYILKKIIEKPAIRGGVAGDVEVVAAKERKEIVKKAEPAEEKVEEKTEEKAAKKPAKAIKTKAKKAEDEEE